MTRRGCSCAGLSVCVAVLVAGLLGCGSSLEPALCTTTRAVIARTVPVLEQRFEVVELFHGCDPVETVSDGVRITLAGTRDFASRSAVASLVRAQLAAAGWTDPGGGLLSLRQGSKRYTAFVEIHSRAPAVAFVVVHNTDPSPDPSVRAVKGAIADRQLSDAQRMRFATFHAFAPGVVPRGYARWEAPAVNDEYNRADVVLTGGRGIRPDLQSRTLPAGYTTHNCAADGGSPPVEGCVLWATTPSGIKLYLPHDHSSADGLADSPTAVVDGTLVQLFYVHEHPAVKPRISRADVLRVFDSLRSANTPAKR